MSRSIRKPASARHLGPWRTGVAILATALTAVAQTTAPAASTTTAPATRSTTQPATQPATQPTPQTTTVPTTRAATTNGPTATAPATQPNTQPTTQPTPTTRPTTPRAESELIAPDRPNLLIICANDLPASATSLADHPIVHTPRLEALAKQGTHFARCYATIPQDGPSTATILTGQFPHTHGTMNDKDPLRAYADTFSARLKRAGYHCAWIGQWQLPGLEAAQPGHGFDDYVASFGPKATWLDSDVWVQGAKTKTTGFLTDWIAERTIDYVRQPKHQPFLAFVHFRAPGEPLTWPPGTEQVYPPDDVGLPATMNVDENQRPPALRTAEAVRTFARMKPADVREARSKFFAMVTHLDAQVGRILDAVDAMDSPRPTIVIFTADTGIAVGDHRLVGKGPMFYEELVAVPLIVRGAPHARPGTTIDRVVSLVDLAPTLLDWAGLKTPITVEGRSLTRLLHKPDHHRHADEAFLEYHEQKGRAFGVRGVVTGQFKFVDHLRSTDELYDIKRDPNEMHNAVNDIEYLAVVKVLLDRLNHWREQTDDPEAPIGRRR